MLFERNNFSVPLSRPGVRERREQPAEDDAPGEEADTILEEHDCASALGPALVNLALDKNMSLREEILQLRKQIEKLNMKQQFGIHCFAGSETFGFVFFFVFFNKVRCPTGSD